MNLLKEKEQPLLGRKRVIYEYFHPKASTPSRLEIKKSMAAALKVNENKISIRHIYTKYGSGYSKIITHIYDDESNLIKFESVKKKDLEKQKKSVGESQTNG